MFKLIACYTRPEDTTAFDRHFAEVHLPLVRQIPGLVQVVVNHGIKAPWGAAPPYYLLVEMHFADEASFNTAMASRENALCGKDLRNFANNLVTLMVATDSQPPMLQ